ncbi:hypothetical protein OSTOST_14825 [Ostertagia ostertagi]
MCLQENSEIVSNLISGIKAVLSRAIATLDNISLSTPFTESKKESARLAKDLRDFVVNLQLAQNRPHSGYGFSEGQHVIVAFSQAGLHPPCYVYSKEKNLAKTNEARSSPPSTPQATSTMTTGNTTATSLFGSPRTIAADGGSTETASTKTAPAPATSAARSTLMITAKSASPSAQAHTAKPESSAPTPASLTKTALPTTPPPVSTNAAPPTTPPPVSSTKTALQKPPSPQASKQLPTPIPQATPGQTVQNFLII